MSTLVHPVYFRVLQALSKGFGNGLFDLLKFNKNQLLIVIFKVAAKASPDNPANT